MTTLPSVYKFKRNNLKDDLKEATLQQEVTLCGSRLQALELRWKRKLILHRLIEEHKDDQKPLTEDGRDSGSRRTCKVHLRGGRAVDLRDKGKQELQVTTQFAGKQVTIASHGTVV